MQAREPVPYRQSQNRYARRNTLAAIFQEPLTVVVRLRSDRLQVSDAAQFRRQMLDLLRGAMRRAQELGFSEPAGRLCTEAVVAFIDETVLNLRHPAFADWRGKPLQEELSGRSIAGEMFFENLKRLVAQEDNDELADVLEVFFLCLLLGYRGRYGVTAGGDLNSLCNDLHKRISRIRQSSMTISTGWAPPRENVAQPKSTGSFGFIALAITAVFAALLLFVGFGLSLRSSAAEIDSSISASGVGN